MAAKVFGELSLNFRTSFACKGGLGGAPVMVVVVGVSAVGC